MIAFVNRNHGIQTIGQQKLQIMISRQIEVSYLLNLADAIEFSWQMRVTSPAQHRLLHILSQPRLTSLIFIAGSGTHLDRKKCAPTTDGTTMYAIGPVGASK